MRQVFLIVVLVVQSTSDLVNSFNLVSFLLVTEFLLHKKTLI